MHLTFLTSLEDDGIHFLEAKENVIIFLDPRAALDHPTTAAGDRGNSPLVQESCKTARVSGFKNLVLTFYQPLHNILATIIEMHLVEGSNCLGWMS